MMCRGGLVVGESAGTLRFGVGESSTPSTTRSASVPKALIAITVLATAIAWTVPANIPPLIESDYAYLLTAADRWYAGFGPTTTSPVAPNQPWEWKTDWTFLTKWPIGYPAILVALRSLLGVSTLQACHLVSWIAAATALVGWFLWLRRLAPQRLGGWLLAAVGAGSALTTGFFVNPSTDLILVATLPYILLLVGVQQNIRTRSGSDGPWVSRADCPPPSGRGSDPSGSDTMSMGLLNLAGLLSGGLFSIRYASLFVPAGIAAYLAVEWIRRRSSLRSLLAFAIAACVPIGAMIFLNRTLAGGDSLQSQLNLGNAAHVDFSWSTIVTAWSTFTELGYYAHRPATRWFLMVLPLGTLTWLLMRKPGNSEVRATGSSPASVRTSSGLCLNAFVLAAGLLMLIVGSTFFRTKFDFVALERYYLPLRPLYFALFLAPLVWIDQVWVRGMLCVALLAAGSWTLQQEWVRDLSRWSAAAHPATASRTRSQCFEPGAKELFAWLAAQNDPSLVVLSNFHEFVALETGIPAIPIPPDRQTLDRWLERIAQVRRIAAPRPVFVLNPTNGTRDYWMPAPASVIETFDLRPALAPIPMSNYLFAPSASVSALEM